MDWSEGKSRLRSFWRRNVGGPDEDTPYIYEHTDPATGQKGYVVAGGTVEDFGWVEISQMDNAAAMSGENFSTASIAELYEAQEAQKAQGEGYGGEFSMVDAGSNRPWLNKALEQLDLDANAVG